MADNQFGSPKSLRNLASALQDTHRQLQNGPKLPSHRPGHPSGDARKALRINRGRVPDAPGPQSRITENSRPRRTEPMPTEGLCPCGGSP